MCSHIFFYLRWDGRTSSGFIFYLNLGQDGRTYLRTDNCSDNTLHPIGWFKSWCSLILYLWLKSSLLTTPSVLLRPALRQFLFSTGTLAVSFLVKKQRLSSVLYGSVATTKSYIRTISPLPSLLLGRTMGSPPLLCSLATIKTYHPLPGVLSHCVYTLFIYDYSTEVSCPYQR